MQKSTWIVHVHERMKELQHKYWEHEVRKKAQKVYSCVSTRAVLIDGGALIAVRDTVRLGAVRVLARLLPEDYFELEVQRYGGVVRVDARRNQVLLLSWRDEGTLEFGGEVVNGRTSKQRCAQLEQLVTEMEALVELACEQFAAR